MKLQPTVALILLLLLLLLHSSHASADPRGTNPNPNPNLPYMTSNASEISGKSFDYIVVGGGTAGCPLAATLSEKFSVLLIERGGSPYSNPWITEKLYYGFSLLETDEFSSVSQSFLTEEGVACHRGRVLGGSTAINGGFYSRASCDFVRKAGWEEEAVKEAYEWVESRIVTMPELTMWQAVVEFGMLEAGILPYNGFTWEHVEGTKIGGSTFDQSGKRRTSADLLKAGRVENITVLLNATVKGVMFTKCGESNRTIARGIQFIDSIGEGNRTYEAYLNRPKSSNSSTGDVILSAGTLGSPQILLLSGIGPKTHLNQLKIPLILESNHVGRQMKDNPGIAILVDSKPENRFPDSPQVAGITKGLNFIIESGILPVSFNTTRIPIAIKLAFPKSQGELKLNSTDPRKNPIVSYNYLKNEEDMEQCVKMAELVKAVGKSRPVEMFLGKVAQDELISNPDELRIFCRRNVRTYYHYHGGCRVGSVVDRDYRVVGVEGLRVVDGSTFSESPGTNPMATLMMLGRYQGIKILSEREGSPSSNR